MATAQTGKLMKVTLADIVMQGHLLLLDIAWDIPFMVANEQTLITAWEGGRR